MESLSTPIHRDPRSGWDRHCLNQPQDHKCDGHNPIYEKYLSFFGLHSFPSHTKKQTSVTTLQRAWITLTVGGPLARAVNEEQTSRTRKPREGCVTHNGQEKLPSTAWTCFSVALNWLVWELPNMS